MWWNSSLISATMGPPKQKWAAEEENALKAGVAKHGAGKWRTILKDPEFNAILASRSNVDLVVRFFVLVLLYLERDNLTASNPVYLIQ